MTNNSIRHALDGESAPNEERTPQAEAGSTPQEMHEITEVAEQIAFATNLLAFNAAAGAARDGGSDAAARIAEEARERVMRSMRTRSIASMITHARLAPENRSAICRELKVILTRIVGHAHRAGLVAVNGAPSPSSANRETTAPRLPTDAEFNRIIDDLVELKPRQCAR